MISEIKAKEVDNTDKLYEQLIEDFNKLAKEKKTKFQMGFSPGNLPFIIKTIFLGWGNSLGDTTIVYDPYMNQFKFYGGVDEETFKEFKFLLEELKQEFLIEVI
jgi:hypothetical protein